MKSTLLALTLDALVLIIVYAVLSDNPTFRNLYSSFQQLANVLN